MKLLHIINSLMAGGAEKLLVDAALQYQQRGCHVTVLLLNGTQTPFYEQLQAHKNIRIIDHGIEGSIYNPKHIVKIKKIMADYDVVHAHLFPSLYWTAIAKALTRKNIRCIYTEHNTHNRRRTIAAFKFIDRWAYAQYDALVAVSSASHQSLKQYLNDQHDAVIKIDNGIDLHQIRQANAYTKSALGFQHDTKLLLQVSSFTAQKDQQTVISAMQYLDDSTHLLLVGDGPLKHACQHHAQSLKLDHRVHFLGVRGDVPRLLKSVDVIVLASHFEGLSLASIEGMASGKPFIVSDVPGLNDVVSGAGLLFEHQNVMQLAERIKPLLTDTEQRNGIVERCLARAEQYDISLMIDRYLALYTSSD